MAIFFFSAKSNYEHNKQQNQPGPGQYINGQGSYGHFKYGAYASDYNGCGWIAIYNALIAMELYLSPADIIYWLEANKKLFVAGMFGTKVSAIKAFLKAPGLSVQKKRGSKNLDEIIKASGVFVLEYFYTKKTFPFAGMHFVTIRYNQANQKYYIYNLYSNRFVPDISVSVNQWLADKKRIYITGLIVS